MSKHCVGILSVCIKLKKQNLHQKASPVQGASANPKSVVSSYPFNNISRRGSFIKRNGFKKGLSYNRCAVYLLYKKTSDVRVSQSTLNSEGTMPDCSHRSLQFGHTSRPCCRASMVSTSSILDEKLHPTYGMETRFASVTHSQKSAGRDEPLTTDIGRITRIKIKDYGVIPCVVPAIVTEPTFCSRNFFPVLVHVHQPAI